jgi:hypothetical protein
MKPNTASLFWDTRYIYIYLIIYEIKYKTNVVTQSFMPEFTDNLRTTKVLLTVYIYIYSANSKKVVYGAHFLETW